MSNIKNNSHATKANDFTQLEECAKTLGAVIIDCHIFIIFVIVIYYLHIFKNYLADMFQLLLLPTYFSLYKNFYLLKEILKGSTRSP